MTRAFPQCAIFNAQMRRFTRHIVVLYFKLAFSGTKIAIRMCRVGMKKRRREIVMPADWMVPLTDKNKVFLRFRWRTVSGEFTSVLLSNASPLS